jgi:hypothetical protein
MIATLRFTGHVTPVAPLKFVAQTDSLQRNVILDTDLAGIYGIPTFRLRE